MRVLNLNLAAGLGGMSRRNLEKLIAEGAGPAIVKLSARRIGVLEDDWQTWLLARRLTSPGQKSAEAVVSRHREAASTTVPARAA